jgi:ubiquinone/menaquinone biosynthesis C-methylase UbiE
MTTMIDFDEDVSRRVESVYTTQDVIEQRRVVRQTLALRPGERVPDIGVGPGFLATEMAAEVGAGGRVCGIDPSESMLRRDGVPS